MSAAKKRKGDDATVAVDSKTDDATKKNLLHVAGLLHEHIRKAGGGCSMQRFMDDVWQPLLVESGVVFVAPTATAAAAAAAVVPKTTEIQKLAATLSSPDTVVRQTNAVKKLTIPDYLPLVIRSLQTLIEKASSLGEKSIRVYLAEVRVDNPDIGMSYPLNTDDGIRVPIGWSFKQWHSALQEVFMESNKTSKGATYSLHADTTIDTFTLSWK